MIIYSHVERIYSYVERNYSHVERIITYVVLLVFIWGMILFVLPIAQRLSCQRVVQSNRWTISPVRAGQLWMGGHRPLRCWCRLLIACVWAFPWTCLLWVRCRWIPVSWPLGDWSLRELDCEHTIQSRTSHGLLRDFSIGGRSGRESCLHTDLAGWSIWCWKRMAVKAVFVLYWTVAVDLCLPQSLFSVFFLSGMSGYRHRYCPWEMRIRFCCFFLKYFISVLILSALRLTDAIFSSILMSMLSSSSISKRMSSSK